MFRALEAYGRDLKEPGAVEEFFNEIFSQPPPLPTIVDVGIGSYEYWGARCVDSQPVPEGESTVIAVVLIYSNGYSQEVVENLTEYVLRENIPVVTEVDGYELGWLRKIYVVDEEFLIAICYWEPEE